MYSQDLPKKLPNNRYRTQVPQLPATGSSMSSLDGALESSLLNNLKKYPPPYTTPSGPFPLTAGGVNNFHTQGNSTTNTSPTKSKGADDQDLLTIMASRLAKLEDAAKALKAESLKKDQHISELLKANGEYKVEIKHLKSQQGLLKSQIHEMETFLNEYGLLWVGSDDSGDDDDTLGHGNILDDYETYKDGADEQPVQPFKLDITKIKRNIAELNILAGEGKAEVVHTKGGLRRLKEPDAVPLTFYSNGFMLFEGPFRPYNLSSSLPFIMDIMDGYFPYELKDRYPNGVPFKLHDKSSEEYLTSKQPFYGMGTSLDAPTKSNLHSIHDDQRQLKTRTKEEFLKSLPASVIKNGRVIDIRASVAGSMSKGSNAGVAVAHTDFVSSMCMGGANNTNLPTTILLQQTPRKGVEDALRSVVTPQIITTLKIKTHTGTLIVKLRFDDTIATLRRYIDQHNDSSGGPRQYELRTTFPNKVYDDVHATLQTSGLVPNATLYVKSC